MFLLCSDGLSGQVTDPEMGAVATALPPAEACRFLVDLANLRGGPDNITGARRSHPARPGGQRHRQGGGAEVAEAAAPAWWLLALAGGALLAFGAAAMHFNSVPGGLFVFLLAAVAIVAGLVGLGLHYRKEQKQQTEEEEPSSPPRVHRRAACRIDPRADRPPGAGRGDPEAAGRGQRTGSRTARVPRTPRARQGAASGGQDLAGAFREYCRAMLPLSQALSKHRKKEEVFQPIWDKNPDALRRKIDPGFSAR